MGKPLNIMLLQCEDTTRHFGCYGDNYAKTPRIDAFARESCRYDMAFSHAPVCAPSRGGMVTGCYPWSIGNHFMRCKLANPPRLFTHELVDAGYHVSWPTKLDFNFDPSPGWCTDQNEWKDRPTPDKPFFVYRNFHITHESRMFNEVPDWHGEDFPCPDESRHDPADAPVPPYIHDCPEARKQIATYYDAVSAIDTQIGECLDWLEKSGHADNTIVILLSDHGRGLPREKRWCYEAGIHLPLIVRWPGKITPGSVSDEMVAWVDIAPTILSLAGVKIPSHYQGQVFLGDQKAAPREFIFAGRDRMDAVYDKVRVARDQRYLYIRNDAPELPYAQWQNYMEQQPVMPVMRALHADGKLEGAATTFFTPHKAPVELYDTETDLHQLNNLADDPAYADIKQRLKNALDQHLETVGDLGEITEEELILEGVVTNQLRDYKKRLELPGLPPEQIIGPDPLPTTLREYHQTVKGS